MIPDRDNALRAASPYAVRLYRSLRAAVRPFGPFREEVKKTSVHFVRASAFGGGTFSAEPFASHHKSCRPHRLISNRKGGPSL